MDPAPVILLVEDDPNDEQLTRIALERTALRHKLVVLRDGSEAVKWLDEEPVMPRVVLLDLKLPKLNGTEVLDRIRADERTRLLPVVIFSSSDEDRDRYESFRRGANAYVRKPVDFGEYKKVVADLGCFWTVHNVPPRPAP